MTKEEARQQFATMIEHGEANLELDRATLLIAAEEYPTLQVDEYLAQLDALAEEARQRMTLGELFDPLDCATTLAAHLFYKGRFTGNLSDYYDARNSFLNDVIDRGKGIPITLAVIFIEVARRLGVKLFGVGMPGHFLVKYCANEGEAFFDPFNGGRVLTEADCRRMIDELYAGQTSFDRSFLHAVTKKQILSRMLQNLKNIYAQASDWPKLLGVIERLLILNPDAAQEIRDRGLTFYRLKKYSQARADLETYLRRVPQAEDKDKLQNVLNDIRQRQAQLN
ncbi:MAG TPA: tetratricopeptide repeat protein [Blastocatellia bacterium]|nr:tetratricopeptide repeat protein [Blastocatellia bacterium]